MCIDRATRAAMLAALILGSQSTPAAAQDPKQQERWCEGTDEVAADRALQACTALIQSGRYDGIRLATMFRRRGNAHSDLNQYDRAIQDYDEAIRLNPKDAAAFTNRGGAYFEKRQYGRAIQDLDEAIRLDPKDAYAFYSRGVVYTRMGQIERAIQDFSEAIRLDPKDPAAFYNRGVLHARRGSTTEQSRTMTRPSSSIRKTSTRSTTAVFPTFAGDNTTARSRTTTMRSC